MKKYIAFLALAGIILTTGCASGESANNSSNALAPDPSETEIAPDIEPDIAFLTREVQTEPETPPTMLVSWSGNGIATAALMTLGSYEWTYGGETSTVSSESPLRAYTDGLITAVADLDLVSENEPQIQLNSGAEITGAKFCPLDDSSEIELSCTADGVISFPSDVYSGVATVSLSFEQGTAEYYFAVTRSQTDPSQPPELLLYFNDANDYGWRMTKGGYTWTVVDGDEARTVTTDCPSPWQMAESNSLKYSAAEPGQSLIVGLPENSRITSAVIYTSEDESVPLEYSGNTINAPDIGGAVCITVEMPAGTCDYLFLLSTSGNDGELFTPAETPAAE